MHICKCCKSKNTWYGQVSANFGESIIRVQSSVHSIKEKSFAQTANSQFKKKPEAHQSMPFSKAIWWQEGGHISN
jgi:hypothetical protein